MLHLRAERMPNWLQRWILPVLVTLLTLSLLLHALTLFSLVRVRSLTREYAGALTTQVEQAKNDTIKTSILINQTVPIQATVPVQKQLSVPISTTVTINQNLPIDTPLGTVDIPINTTLPVNLTIPVTISETIAVDTSVALNMNLPIDVPIAGTAIGTYLDDLLQSLRNLLQQL